MIAAFLFTLAIAQAEGPSVATSSVSWTATATCAGDLAPRECELLIAGLELEQEVHDLRVELAGVRAERDGALRVADLCTRDRIYALVPPCPPCPEGGWSWSACATCGAVASGLTAGVVAYGAVQICR